MQLNWKAEKIIIIIIIMMMMMMITKFTVLQVQK
jgi:hypothetical protein